MIIYGVEENPTDSEEAWSLVCDSSGASKKEGK